MKAALKEPKELIFDSVEAFITKRHPKGDIFFLVKCKKTLSYNEDGLYVFKLILEPVIIDAPQEIGEIKKRKLEKWELTINKGYSDSNPRVNFPGLFLHPDLHSCGIGSVMFNMMIKEGWNYFSNAKAKLELREDSNKENTLRKEKFYKKFGLIIDYDKVECADGYARISSFDDLYVFTEFKNIVSLDVTDQFLSKSNQVNELNYEMHNLKHSNESLLKSIMESEDKYMTYRSRFLKCILGGILIIGFCGYILKL